MGEKVKRRRLLGALGENGAAQKNGGFFMQFDVAVIGAGVCGAMITRELSKLELSVVMLEKCNDIAMGTSKANSAIVHARLRRGKRNA